MVKLADRYAAQYSGGLGDGPGLILNYGREVILHLLTQFNQQQITHAVLSFMAIKQNQPHITDCAIYDDAADLDDETPGTIRPGHLPDHSHIAPDEYAARRDAVRVIRSMIPESDLELYDLWLAVRENGQRGEPGTLHRLRDYAQRQRID